MSSKPPYLGIDFGTTYSSMAWYNPGNNPPHTGQAEIILNSDGEPKTPSTVYFGEDETLVGRLAERMLEDASEEQDQREEVFQRTVRNIKRELIAPPRIALPGTRFVRPAEVASEILKKLKLDAEDGVFHEEVPRAVITCPAEFDVMQRQAIERAGQLAGFQEVVLAEEPVAGALAYAHSGRRVGRHVLVYDLGGGTFDLAVLDNEGDSFHVGLEPKGIDKIGGEDFDLALYYHCDEIARVELGRPVSPTGTLDLKFLRECRERKENLSVRERVTVSSLLPGSVAFRHQLDRRKFNELIADYVETTVRLTEAILNEAEDTGHKVDTVVLIGGSSKVLLVRELLNETLPVPPLAFDKRDFAVALGAANFANLLWEPPPTPSSPRPDTDGNGKVEVAAKEKLDRYRQKVAETAGSVHAWDRTEVDRLDAFATQLGLAREQAAAVEQEVLGETKEAALIRRYREAVGMVWADGRLSDLEADWLGALAGELGLDRDEAANAERASMGATREELAEPSHKAETPDDTDDFVLDSTLEGHSGGVNSVAFTPDGEFLASGGSEGVVRGWNVRTGQPAGTLRDPLDRVNSVALDPNGTFLAAGGFDKTVRVWKLPKGEPLNTFNHAEWVWSVAVSPDGRTLASGGADRQIKLWNLETAELLHTFEGHSHWVLSVAMSPDGRALFSGGADGTVRMWELETGRLLRTLEHTDWVWSVAPSSDGKRIAGGGEDGAIGVWEAETGEVLHAIRAHTGPVLSVAMDPDGDLLFSGGADSRIKVWSLRTGELLNMMPGHSDGIGAMALSQDGSLLASGGSNQDISIWRRRPRPKGADRRPPEPGQHVGQSTSPARPGSLPDAPRPGAAEPSSLPDLPPDLPD